MPNFNVWITLLTPLYGERIVGKLVNKGYQVKAMSGDLFGVKGNAPCSLMAMIIYSNTGLKQIWDDTTDAIKAEKVKYFSMIVTEDAASFFGGGNISLSKPQEPKKKKAKRVEYLQLVKPPIEEKKSNE